MATTPTIAQMVTDICERAGLASDQIDTSQLAGMTPSSSCLGYVVERPTPAAQALRTLMEAFFFDACESDGKIKFVPESGPTLVQSAFNSQLSGPAVPVFPQPNTPGNLLFAFCTADNPDPSPSDTAGNTWTQLYLVDAVEGIGGYGIWYAIANGFTGQNTVTFTEQTFFGATHMDGFILEIAGAAVPTFTNTTGSAITATATSGDGKATFSIAFHTTSSATPYNISIVNLGSFYLALVGTQQGSVWTPPLSLSAGWTQILTGAWSGVFFLTAPVFLIPEIDLGLQSDKCEIVEQQAQEQDLPQRVTVLYNDPALDYQQGKQEKTRSARIVQSKQRVLKSLPITLTGTQARQIAEVALWLAWLERSSYQMNLWRAIYMMLDPTDVVAFVYEGLTFQMRIKDNLLGAGYAVNLNGVSYDIRNFLSSAVGGTDSGFSPAPMRLAANTLLFLLDIPLLTDTDSNPAGTGYYDALSSQIGDWGGAVLYDSSDETSWTAEGNGTSPVSFGTTTGVLGAPRSPWTWDKINTLNIVMQVGALAGDTLLNVLNGSNQLIVGSEIIQYTTAVQNMDGSFTISGLLRGRRGTEWACSGHASGDLVLVPSTGMQRQTQTLANLNRLRYYQAVTIGQALGTAPIQDFTITGADLKPYAPVHIAGSRDGGNNLTTTWTRRTRIGWNSLSQDPVPLSEDSELYQVDIMSGLTVLRSITGLTSPAASYSAAEQTADGLTPGDPVTLNVYQISGEVGKGFPGSATV